MKTDPELIERIYEAAALPDRWPLVLEAIADDIGAIGATVCTQTVHGLSIIPTPRIERIVSDYISEGWAADPEYAAPLILDKYPGFRAECRYRSIEEIERLPVHVEFLAPRGMVAGVGTTLQGARDDVVHMALEGLPSHDAAAATEARLNLLRAPLGRALSLTALISSQKLAATVTALNLAGVAAAVVSGDGRLRAANDRFVSRLGDRIIDRASGLRFADQFLQSQFSEALLAFNFGAGVRSIAVASDTGEPAFAIHLLPLKRGARDVFGWDGVLMMIAEAANASVPNSDLLRLLFDLTPAEALLTRDLVEGLTLSQAAAAKGIRVETARSHLRSVFTKTGVRRQAELVRLLAGLGAPIDSRSYCSAEV